MLQKAGNSKGEMPYCFPRSSIKFQGHTGQNITDFDSNWAFLDYRPVAAFKSLRFALFAIYGAIFYCVWQEHISTNLKLTQKKIGGNVIENVNKMAALLFRPLFAIAEQYSISLSWWRHDIKALHSLLTLFKGIPMWQVTGDYLPKGTVMRNCDVVFVMGEDKLLNSRVAGD